MISICIITKNEEKNIGRCLESIKHLGQEIVVLDTGSTDATKEIAKRYTTSVYDFCWQDDFSEARNECARKATKDYILFMDSDEFIDNDLSMNFSEIVSTIMNNDESIGTVVIRNIFTKKECKETRERVGRVYNREKYCYCGRIHEQLRSIDGAKETYYKLSLFLGHTGYDLDHSEAIEKAHRNITLLNEELSLAIKNHKKEEVPYIYYQLGKSFYMSRDFKEASTYFEKAMEYDLDSQLIYVQDLVETYGYTLIETNCYEKALGFENIYQVFCESSDFLFLMGLIYMKNAMFDRAISEFLFATQKKECKVQGVNSFLAFYNAGVIEECRGHIDEAIGYYKKCGDYKLARDRLKELR